jgi:hypothetical protein
MNICILILSTNNKDYDCFKSSIRSTWLSDFKNKSIDCFFYEGDSDMDQIIGDTIYLSVKDEIKHTFFKFYKCLELLKSSNKKYDLYFRANLSCYIDVFEFIKFIKHFNLDKNSYSGKLGVTHLLSEMTLKYKILRVYKEKLKKGLKIEFYSGAGFFIGSNKVEFILKYGNYFKNTLIVDDVLIGLILITKSYSKLTNNILKILEVKFEPSFKLSENEFFSLIKQNHLFFYRFKNSDRTKDCEYIFKFSDPSFRKQIILNGFTSNEFIETTKVEMNNSVLLFPLSFKKMYLNLIYFIRMFISYLILFVFVKIFRFLQKLKIVA